ncbi:MAG: ribosome biogenesis GTPase Der [Spirochaetaceae bacterium]|jgi:GTP-binding protein|nr:ribosome biogenesis GTPase Der [Spirochaetaceae bacterium]
MLFLPELKYRNLPSVVLAGRPNVGKSTLFNRFAHTRRTITDPTPGVTRDAVEMVVFIAGMPVRLIDTGGYKLDREKKRAPSNRASGTIDTIDDLVIEKSLDTLKQADIIILMFAAGEITGEDEEFINVLRSLQKKIIPVVNKTEGGRLLSEAYNVLSFGFENIYLISAEHGDNIGQLADAIIAKLDFSKVELDDVETRTIKIALLGKPNTGKSTLSNRLTSSDNSLVSNIPGTTRDVIEGAFTWKEKHFLVLDTAGIRRRSRVEENIEYYSVNRAIKTLDECDVAVLMIDAEEGLSEQDKKITALACDRGCGVIFVLNKWDLMGDVKNTFNAVRDRIHFLFAKMEYAPIIPLSAKTGDGVSELLSTTIKIYSQLTRRIETSTFNGLLEKWQSEYPPPSGPHTRFKIKYGLQVSDNPAIFKLFVSRPQAFTESYGSYICNKLRKDAGYSLIPVQLDICPSRKERRGTKT